MHGGSLRKPLRTARPDRRIHTISFVDISYSWGPAIHFVELWNQFTKVSNRSVVGYSVLERGDRPYSELEFRFRPLRLDRFHPVKARRLGKAMYDLWLLFHFLWMRQTTVYIRLSRFGIFLLLALLVRNHRVFLEVNGLALEDSLNASSTSSRVSLWYAKLLEKAYMRLRGATIIAVAPRLASTIRERYGVCNTVTIGNGCDRALVERFANKKTSRHPALNIGFLGTFTPWDGHERTADLYRVLKRAGREVIFHIAGPGVAASDVYRQFIHNRDFRFYETIPYRDLWKFYTRLDAAYAFDRIDRSRSVEQSTLKLLEYWASRIPIISTRALGNEFVEALQLGVLLSEDELIDEELFYRRILVFLENLERYQGNFAHAPPPRTWKDVAEDTKRILDRGAEPYASAR
jgi:glycosyltransferase involved in cell wall biosynthesis